MEKERHRSRASVDPEPPSTPGGQKKEKPLAKEFEELATFELDLKRDTGSFYGDYRQHPAPKDYCDDSKKLKMHLFKEMPIFDKLFDMHDLRKELLPRHFDQLQKSNHMFAQYRAVKSGTDDPLRVAVERLMQRDRINFEVPAESESPTKKRYCELRNKLNADPRTKESFLELIRLTLEQEKWQRYCGAAGTKGNASYVGYTRFDKMGHIPDSSQAYLPSYPKEDYRRIIVCPGFALKANPNDRTDQLNKLGHILGHELGHDNSTVYHPSLFDAVLQCQNAAHGNRTEDSADLLGLETMLQHLNNLRGKMTASLVEQEKISEQLADIVALELSELCPEKMAKKDPAKEIEEIHGIPDTHADGLVRVQRVMQDPYLRGMLGCPALPKACSLRNCISSCK